MIIVVIFATISVDALLIKGSNMDNVTSLLSISKEPSILNVLVREFEPYTIRTGDGRQFGGIEGMLLETIARKLEIELTFVDWSPEMHSNEKLNETKLIERWVVFNFAARCLLMVDDEY